MYILWEKYVLQHKDKFILQKEWKDLLFVLSVFVFFSFAFFSPAFAEEEYIPQTFRLFGKGIQKWRSVEVNYEGNVVTSKNFLRLEKVLGPAASFCIYGADAAGKQFVCGNTDLIGTELLPGSYRLVPRVMPGQAIAWKTVVLLEIPSIRPNFGKEFLLQ